MIPIKKMLCLLVFAVALIFNPKLSAQSNFDHPYPFATNDSTLTIWNGTEYIPFFVKGVNLGVAVPGTFPGQMAATRENYWKWFKDIKDAGFNNIRLYTLHFPRFYEVLDSFNLENPNNPLMIMQGVWLEEEIPGYNEDLYSLSNAFKQEIKENIDCIHGNKFIAPRVGKAHGDYNTDVSKWCMAYIIGREIYPSEVMTTDENNAEITTFSGNHLSISNASPSEAWVAEHLDYLLTYEYQNYQTQRPVSNSSWPTLDPLEHPEETHTDEDIAQIDLSKIELHNAPAGFFISYHAYPYYPDFVSLQTSYQVYFDDYGQNSYLGYLIELRSHYEGIPVIIAEYGVPSSWIIAHYATSGMNHGGFDELEQGQINIRLLETIRSANCGGGILFAWIDEWFKRTWVTDPVDYIADSRILWHNISAAEQNYGLIKFSNTLQSDTLVQFQQDNAISYLKSEVNHAFFELEIGLKNPLDIPDEMWITFDTYAEELGESILPNGETIPNRSEFALNLTNYAAKLYVTEAYDIFQIWHNISHPNQLYKSIPTDGAPWEIVRIRNNNFHSDIQYTGNLQVNYDFQPPSSKDGVTIGDDKILVRIPWSYLNMVAPDQMKVLHDDKFSPVREDTISDGFKVNVHYKSQWYSHPDRFIWNPWVMISDDITEEYKTSYYWMKNNLNKFNTPVIAVRDTFYFDAAQGTPFVVDASNGVLKNDFDLDGNEQVALVFSAPQHGTVSLFTDGSFEYQPTAGFNGTDSLQYVVFDGYSLSTPNTAVFRVVGQTNNIPNDLAIMEKELIVYPNPVITELTITSDELLREVMLFDALGQLVFSKEFNGQSVKIDCSFLPAGNYLVVAKQKINYLTTKVIKH